MKTDHAPTAHYVIHQVVAFKKREHMPASFEERHSLKCPQRNLGPITYFAGAIAVVVVLAWVVGRVG